MVDLLLTIALVFSTVAMLSLLGLAWYVSRIDRVLTVWAETWPDETVRAKLLQALGEHQ